MAGQKTPFPLNPFTVGGALSDASGYGFFGREDIFEFVRDALDVVRRNPILLLGQRRIGKSSILWQISHRLSPNLVCVYFDLQGKDNMDLDSVLYGLGREIARKMKLGNPSREDTTEETFSRVFLPRIFEHLGEPRRLVLLLDEFDVIDETVAGNAIAAKSFIPYLGQYVAVYGQVGLIFVLGRKTEEMSASFNSSLIKDAVQKRIGRLPYEDIASLVKKLSAGSIDFSEAAILRLYELTSGHPFCTQVLCHTLWKQFASSCEQITAEDVAGKVSAAVELGSLGMNWLYDGLVTPEQRLFLSSLTEAADPIGGERVSPSKIQQILRDKRLSVESAALERAAYDLLAWEIIEGSRTEGYRFAVPLIGAWIRKERSLELLESEARFVNRIAWNFYELAVEHQRRGDLEAAIADYKNALTQHPDFREAQRALASALQKSGKPGSLSAAIEAWERVLELDPDAPRNDLLDALMRALELSTKPTIIRSYFRRIIELDRNGLIRERAYRNLQERAKKKIEIGSRSAVEKAINFYDLVGDEEGKKFALLIQRKQERIVWMSLLYFPLLISAVVLGRIPGFDQIYKVVGLEEWMMLPDYLRLVLAGLAGMLASWMSIEKDPELTLRKTGLPFLFVGIAVGALILKYTSSLGWAGTIAFFTPFMNVATSTSPIEKEDKPSDLLAPTRSPRLRFIHRILDLIDHNLP